MSSSLTRPTTSGTAASAANRGGNPSRYWKLYDLCGGQAGLPLTATPVNNALTDFQHLIELFSREKPDAFAAASASTISPPISASWKSSSPASSAARTRRTLPVQSGRGRPGLFERQTLPRTRRAAQPRLRQQSQKQQGSAEALFPDQGTAARRRLLRQEDLRPPPWQSRSRLRQGKTPVRPRPVSTPWITPVGDRRRKRRLRNRSPARPGPPHPRSVPETL